MHHAHIFQTLYKFIIHSGHDTKNKKCKKQNAKSKKIRLPNIDHIICGLVVFGGGNLVVVGCDCLIMVAGRGYRQRLNISDGRV